MKAVLITLAIIIIGSLAAWMLLGNGNQDTASNVQTQTTQSNESTNQSTSIQNGQVTVSISNFRFPQTIKISKGSTITWVNQDSTQHNVVSDEDSPQQGLDGPLLGKGESYSFTFNELGTYNYHCQPHPNMTGVVEVVDTNVTEVNQ